MQAHKLFLEHLWIFLAKNQVQSPLAKNPFSI